MQGSETHGRSLCEPHKREGVRYALTEDGIELAVVDVTQRQFALEWNAALQHETEAAFLRQQAAFAKMPRWMRSLLLTISLRKSLLARGIRQSRGGYLSGMGTYLLKLGPDNLPSRLAQPVDRNIADSLPGRAVRLRMQDMAELTAKVAAAELRSANPKQPLHLLNIASGPAIDSLNALLVLQRDDPTVLRGHHIVIHALDIDEKALVFAQSALEALRRDALKGLDVVLTFTRFDWTQPTALRDVLANSRSEDAVALVTSEGGLFEYGTDNQIIDSLREIRSNAQHAIPVIGSVTRNDSLTRKLHESSGAAVHPRGLEAFASLVARAGYRVTEVRERPMSDQVVLRSDA